MCAHAVIVMRKHIKQTRVVVVSWRDQQFVLGFRRNQLASVSERHYNCKIKERAGLFVLKAAIVYIIVLHKIVPC